MTTFKLPDLGEGLESAEIVHWHVGVGDHVSADQPLVSVETEKAVVEIPSPVSGTVTMLAGKPGDLIKVGAPLGEIETAARPDSGAIVGTLESATGAAPSRPPVAPAGTEPMRSAAAPAVRQRARELGIDLSSLTGTGPGGAITREDLEAAAKQVTGVSGVAQGFEPLRGVRRAMAAAMTRAGRSVVPATVTEEANVSHWPRDAEVTLLAVEALIAAVKAQPSLNSAFDDVHMAVRENAEIDIGIAVDTPDGLIVPVLRTGHHPGRGALRRELRRLVDAAHRRSLTPQELQNATITLSNFGMLGGLFANLVVVPPQVAILGVGRMREQQATERLTKWLPLSLTFDHRVVSGGEAARLLAGVKTALESSRPGEAA